MSSLFDCASVNCRADADLKLLGSCKLPREAFKDKVVWITGASQVCFSSVPELLKISAQQESRIVPSESNIEGCSSSSMPGAQGLGEELAICFASHGAKLILSARNRERLEVSAHIMLPPAASQSILQSLSRSIKPRCRPISRLETS